VAALDTRGERVYNALFSPDSRAFATETRKGEIILWDASGQRIAGLAAKEIDYSYFNELEAYGSPSFAFSPDSRAVITFRGRPTQLWDAATGLLRSTLQSAEGRNAAFSPDSRLLVTPSGGGSAARVWDAETGRLVKELPRAPRKTSHLLFSPDGRLFLTASDAGVTLWDASTFEPLAMLARARFPARFSPDGRMLAAGGNGKTALLYELNR